MLTYAAGAMTARSKPPTARNLHREGWGFFASQQASILEKVSGVPGIEAGALTRVLRFRAMPCFSSAEACVEG